MPKFTARLGLAIIIGMLIYWAYVDLFGTGYESKGWEHFAHVLKGISLELPACDRPAPQDLKPVDGPDQHAVELEPGQLVSAKFQDTDGTFYVFITNAQSRDSWLVVHRPKSDYRGAIGFGGKIWVTEIPVIPAGMYFLVTGAGPGNSEMLEDGSKVQALPPFLKYTDTHLVTVMK